MESISHLRSTLQCLIETCKDGEEGFRTAAQGVSDGGIRALCTAHSRQRAALIEELQSVLHGLGEDDPAEAGSVAGTLHRGWINLESALLNKDPHAILVECQRGECCAVTEYEKALALELPPPIREILSAQHAQIVAAHAQIQRLSDAGAARWV